MAAPLRSCTKQEQRGVIRFLWSEGVKSVDIHRRMQTKYGDACLSQRQVYDWCQKFAEGTTLLTDAPRPGQAHRVVTEESIAAADRLIQENRRVTLAEMAFFLSMSFGSVQHIVHDELRYSKVSARWVPRQLTQELKDRRVDACQELLRRYEEGGDDFLSHIVTGDESWVHHFQPETKRASKEWRHSSSPKPKKFRSQPSAGKVMLTLFWDKNGPILEHYMPPHTTVTSATYTDLLNNHLKPAIRTKRRGLLSAGVLLQHDNARPHSARATMKTIDDLRFKCLPHPPYSPDLAPSDFHVFGPLKEHLGGQKFKSDEGVQSAVHEWLQSQPKEFFSRGIEALPIRWRKCIELRGDYVEK